MLSKTRGIVIRYFKYKESSIIVQIFTEHYGLVSFIINGIRSPRSKRSIGYFQALSLLELVVYIKPNREIQRLSEYKSFASVQGIQQDIRKGSIAIFLSEILGKLLYHEPSQPHEGLFDFLTHSILTLDHMESEIENFHLHFLLKATAHLGLGVSDADELLHSMELEMVEKDQKLIKFLGEIMNSEMTDHVDANGALRFRSLELILSYYQHHGIELGEIKSLKVLHQVFR